MRPEHILPGTPSDWLRHAEADLRLAASNVPDVMPSLFCFHAQQAVEKAVKAVLTLNGVHLQRTHDIRNLLDLLPPDIPKPSDADDWAILTKYAVQHRYPGDEEDVTTQELVDAVRLARSAYSWAGTLIRVISARDMTTREQETYSS